MNPGKRAYFAISLLLFSLSFASAYAPQTTRSAHASHPHECPQGLRALMAAYPDFLRPSPDANVIIWKDGSQMRYDDGIGNKDFQTLLNSPDLEDQLSLPYPRGKNLIHKKNMAPGRIRYEPFFKKMYGSSPREVEKHLVAVHWLPSTANKILKVTSINGVAKKLQAISRELEKKPQLLKYVDNPAGAYCWRKISGTDRLSAHCFGIAVDINIKYAHYWRWRKQPARQQERNLITPNRIPMEVVEIFEKYGFIWGGKWYHYDTMHFEYRPELLQY